MTRAARYATEADIPRIVELAEQEHAASSWAGVPFDRQATADTAANFIRGMGHTALVSPGGYLLGLVQPLGFSRRLVAMEYAWFAVDGHGMALLAMFEDWARSMGAAALVTHDHAAADGRLATVLQRRRGYRTMGQALARNLSAAGG